MAPLINIKHDGWQKDFIKSMVLIFMILFLQFITISIILTLAFSYGWKLFQLHVNNVFFKWLICLNHLVEANDKSLVCKLNKAIHGLKQTP